MEPIPFSEIAHEFLRLVPKGSEALQKLPDEVRTEFEQWSTGVDLYDFLSRAFMRPALLPELLADHPDGELLKGSFAFIEGLALSEDEYVQGALHFEVYDQFLREKRILSRAESLLLPAAREGLTSLLANTYGVWGGVEEALATFNWD
ncbi:hypothetical protein [Streptomyces sp. NPDC057302]|uniref:hypothetical protein n=1 Tax=Streptomyces sp. NPDC057302 TaxID=3346094 RepID=UPI003631DB91